MEEFKFDPTNPLERVPREKLRANAALHDYALMGPGRSLRKLLARYKGQMQDVSGTHSSGQRPPTRHWSTLTRWSTEFAWQARVEAWEKLQDRIDEERWAERRALLREDEWSLGSELLNLAKAMLAESPKFLKTTRRVIKETGQEIVTVALDGKFLIMSAEMASKLRRLAAGLDRAANVNLEIDLSNLSNEQLERIANGEDPLHVLLDAAGASGAGEA